MSDGNISVDIEEMDSLKKEVQDIYKVLVESDKELAIPAFDIKYHPQTFYLFARYTLIPFAIAVFATIIAMGLEYFGFILHDTYKIFSLVAMIMILIGYLGIFFTTLLNSFVQFKEIWKERTTIEQFFSNPLIIFFEGLTRTSQENVSTFLILRKFTSEALHIAKLNIEEQKGGILTRLMAMVGAFDKVGLIPGFLSLYFAIFIEKNQKVAVVSAIVIFVFYLIAFVIYVSLPRLGFYLQLIDLAIKNKEDN
ncbi:MAG: hypothetical protein D3923_03165 [Candidatus Electrothrix sp. AR3]|nr:hypothetical protein [Candidatus Electrothrix sp. AR3]